ncbi:MAG: RluA family pseudouridine synthase [Verrucomicrobia bacterium]|nr:RluA family pseudouridine synthase [Verrucomicrobiota bacterium]
MPTASESFVTERSLPGERFDVFLHAKFPHVSRGLLQRMIGQGQVRVNGRSIKPSHHPAAGEVVTIQWSEVKPLGVTSEDIPLEVLFEDECLLVLNKQPGIVVHPAAGHEEHTLVNALLHHCAGQLSGIGGVARPGIVHRLDKDTSGCLVVAKDDQAHLSLSAQFSSREVRKVYHVIVCGELEPSQGEIEAEIARHPNHRKRMAVTAGRGRAARTTYTVQERLRQATLVEAVLHTGRTHQIRVHFQHIGFPVVGDMTYGSRPNKRLAELTGYTAPRQMLHARLLEFTHPRTGERMTLESAWPRDFTAALVALAGRAGEQPKPQR